jgi:2-polyprenyl-6-methoxyphenol hydroxylase-like FAD-dependent oxidoreductase
MTERGNRAIIIGGGPGGLVAAIALRQCGFDPAVYERAGEMRETGSGLTLWPNAMKALDRLGLVAALRSVSLPSAGIAMRSWRGELLFDVPSPEKLEHLFGVNGIAVHRAELLDVLLTVLGREVVRLGARCLGYKQDEKCVRAFFADGSEACGAILIGADGIKSAIRTQLLGRTKLRYAGFTVWRGVVNFDLAEKVGLTTMGRGAQFGLFPMTGRRVYWFASVNASEGDQDWAIGRKRELLERFRGWHEPIEAIIDATHESSILRNDIYDHEPLTRWSDGRVTLLGDAAHPSTPNMGQGACQAIEDAVILATCLRGSQEIASGLKMYESRRIQRTSAITMQSRRMGQMGRWKNPLMCWLRDQLIKSIPEQVRLRQLNGIFHFEG